MNENTATALPLYSRITEYGADWCYVCDEWQAVCPDCGASVCVTCMDECTMCQTPMW